MRDLESVLSHRRALMNVTPLTFRSVFCFLNLASKYLSECDYHTWPASQRVAATHWFCFWRSLVAVPKIDLAARLEEVIDAIYSIREAKSNLCALIIFCSVSKDRCCFPRPWQRCAVPARRCVLERAEAQGCALRKQDSANQACVVGHLLLSCKDIAREARVSNCALFCFVVSRLRRQVRIRIETERNRFAGGLRRRGIQIVDCRDHVHIIAASGVWATKDTCFIIIYCIGPG